MKGGIAHVETIIETTDENIYEGQLLYGEKHGKGVMKCANGAAYEGEFS
jgi:hypothetical protein